MPTQLEMLKEALADHEARHGPDSKFGQALKQQIASLELQQSAPSSERPMPVTLHARTRPAPKCGRRG